MSVLKQFNFARTALLTFIQDLDEDLADHKSNYFENTIRWHIGNILWMDEKLIFISQEKSHEVPGEYAELFSSDINVKDWSVEPPTLTELTEHLVHQQNRINSFNELYWKSNIKFKVPYGYVETYGDLLTMLSYREAEVLGQLKAMKQVYTTSN